LDPRPRQARRVSTIWRTVADLSGGVYVFEPTRRPNIVWVRLAELDLSEGAPARKLDLVADTDLEGGLVGDVSGRFVEAPRCSSRRSPRNRSGEDSIPVSVAPAKLPNAGSMDRAGNGHAGEPSWDARKH
jgi:hypothetical protein